MTAVNVLAYTKNIRSEFNDNLGDFFGYILMDYICQKQDIIVNRRNQLDRSSDTVFSIVGSLLQMLFNRLSTIKQKTIIVVGCGLVEAKCKYFFNTDRLIVAGVRGPLTKNILTGVLGGRSDIEVISDPGLLISDIFSLPPNDKSKYEVGFILHEVDRTAFAKLFPNNVKYIVNYNTTYKNFISDLTKYKRIISSSLHGVIFCHSYNIPVCSVKITDKLRGGDFKFIDYYLSLGRTEYKGRKPIDRQTDFATMCENEWQPSQELISMLKIKQKTVIRSAIEKNTTHIFKK